MRAKTFHSVIGVALLLVGIALISRWSRPSPEPTPAPPVAAATPEPVVYAASTPPASPATLTPRQPVRFDVRKTARAVMLSTLPMAPVLEAVSPFSQPPAPIEQAPTVVEATPAASPDLPDPPQPYYEAPANVSDEEGGSSMNYE